MPESRQPQEPHQHNLEDATDEKTGPIDGARKLANEISAVLEGFEKQEERRRFRPAHRLKSPEVVLQHFLAATVEPCTLLILASFESPPTKDPEDFVLDRLKRYRSTVTFSRWKRERQLVEIPWSYRARYNLACSRSERLHKLQTDPDPQVMSDDQRDGLIERALAALDEAFLLVHGAQRRELWQWAMNDPSLSPLRDAAEKRFTKRLEAYAPPAPRTSGHSDNQPGALEPDAATPRMSIKIIVSYNGTNDENDAIALGGLFAKAGAQVSLAYVRHTNEAVSDEEAQEVLDRGAALFSGTFASSHAITDHSTPEGLRALAQHEGADAIVLSSDSHTAPGSVSLGNSAQRLLDGGRFAIAIAPAGLAEREPVTISAIAATEDPTDHSAKATAESLAAALGASVVAAGDPNAQLLVIGSRPEAGEGQVALSAAALNLVENTTSAVLIVPRRVAFTTRGIDTTAGQPVAL